MKKDTVNTFETMEDATEEMTVTLDLDCGPVTCAIASIFSVKERDYIALMPLDEDGQSDGTYWFYGYSENEADPNEEPKLRYIDDDEEYEIVEDTFDEILDNAEFDEIIDM